MPGNEWKCCDVFGLIQSVIPIARTFVIFTRNSYKLSQTILISFAGGVVFQKPFMQLYHPFQVEVAANSSADEARPNS